jgi:hypothetical protein
MGIRRSVLVGFLVACGSASSVDPASDSSAITGYSPTQAVAYADAHWDDGVGECAEFTTRSLRAGGARIALITWVPDLVDALSGTPFVEYSDVHTAVSARAGDVVVYSDAAGADFCIADSPDEHNCGHAGLVVQGGASVDEILADFHNNAHHHIALSALFGAYTTLRVYHLAPGGCSKDSDCNHGQLGTARVCSDEGACIEGCHSDDDCADGTSCAHESPHWRCE